MPEISKRSQQLGTENAFVVLAEVERLVREGRDVISFCIGQPDFPTPQNVGAAAIRAIKEGRTGYTPSSGIARLREAVASDIGRRRRLDVRPEDVVVGSGAKPFIGYTIASVTDPGEGHEVIYPNPGFPIYESQIRALGAVAVPIHLKDEDAFALNPAKLAELIGPKTRLVIINSPHNPTGALLTSEDLDKLADVFRAHEHVWIYADEIYSRLTYDSPFESIASRKGLLARTIIADGASKTWSMTGWRIGYAVNRALAPHFTRWVTNTESCAGHPNQYAALEAITGPQDQAERMKKTFHERRDLIVSLLNQIPGVNCQLPGGAFYVWPNVTETCKMIGVSGSEELRKLLLQEAGVAVLSDNHFGPPAPGGQQHIRFSYAASTEAIRTGVGRVADLVKKKRR